MDVGGGGTSVRLDVGLEATELLVGISVRVGMRVPVTVGITVRVGVRIGVRVPEVVIVAVRVADAITLRSWIVAVGVIERVDGVADSVGGTVAVKENNRNIFAAFVPKLTCVPEMPGPERFDDAVRVPATKANSSPSSGDCPYVKFAISDASRKPITTNASITGTSYFRTLMPVAFLYLTLR